MNYTSVTHPVWIGYPLLWFYLDKILNFSSEENHYTTTHFLGLGVCSGTAEYKTAWQLCLITNRRYLGTLSGPVALPRRTGQQHSEDEGILMRVGGSKAVVGGVWSNGPPGVPDKDTQQQRDALHQTRRTRGVQKAFSPGAFQPGIHAPWPSRETSFFTQTQWEDERMGQGRATIEGTEGGSEGQCENGKTWHNEYFSHCGERASVVTRR